MTKYRVAGDKGAPMTASDIMYAAELAFAGGLLGEMPANADQAADAFENIGIEIEISEGPLS